MPSSHNRSGRAHDDPVWRVSMSPTVLAVGWHPRPLCLPQASGSTPPSFHPPLPCVPIESFLPWAPLANSSQHSLMAPGEATTSSSSGLTGRQLHAETASPAQGLGEGGSWMDGTQQAQACSDVGTVLCTLQRRRLRPEGLGDLGGEKSMPGLGAVSDLGPDPDPCSRMLSSDMHMARLLPKVSRNH